LNRPFEPFDPRKYLEFRLFWPYSSGIPDQWLVHQIDTVHWMECVRSRKTPNADVEAGYSHSVALCMTIAALHTGQRITFDDEKQDVIIGGRDVTTTAAR
jgi:hypothetical protein